MKKSTLYTKFGDEGKTALASGEVVLKNDQRVITYGVIDELNALIGVLLAIFEDKNDKEIEDFLVAIQKDLFVIGSVLSCPLDKRESFKIPKIGMERVTLVEMAIDTYDSKTSPLKNFILPGGTLLAAQAHYIRTVCRRAERELVRLIEIDNKFVPVEILIYINRLSDYFFALARLLNMQMKRDEVKWP